MISFISKHKPRKLNGGGVQNTNHKIKKNWTLARYFVLILYLILSVISLGEGEVPHSYVWENPEKAVTSTETIKRHKEKAELNITITKIKSEAIKMNHDSKKKKIFFTLDRNNVKRSDGKIRLEATDRVFVTERLEEVPSISTTNGRKKINGLKRQNKSLDTGVIKDGNLTWTVQDSRSIDISKAVTIDYTSFPNNIYVGITDKDYNIKKIFVGNISEMELYSADDLAGYINIYNEDVKVNNTYHYDMSDVVMWTKDNQYVDVKFAELTINAISNTTLMNKNPYVAVENEVITLKGTKGGVITGRLHLVDTSYSSSIPMSLLGEDSLTSKVYARKNYTGTATVKTTSTVYVRFLGSDYQNLSQDTYTIQNNGIVYGHDLGTSSRISLPNMYIYKSVGTGKTIDIDLWLFGTDFSDKINYVINPRNNGTGNLEIRPQDETSGVTDVTNAGNTDSVFDMTGRGVKYDFNDDTRVEVQNVSGFTPTEQNQGNFEKYKNRWAKGSIAGYTVKARVWSDYDGIELDFEKVGSLSTSNDGVRKFKVVHKNADGSIIQTFNITMYVNNNKMANYISTGTGGNQTVFSNPDYYSDTTHFSTQRNGVQGVYKTLSESMHPTYIFKINNFITDEIIIENLPLGIQDYNSPKGSVKVETTDYSFVGGILDKDKIISDGKNFVFNPIQIFVPLDIVKNTANINSVRNSYTQKNSSILSYCKYKRKKTVANYTFWFNGTYLLIKEGGNQNLNFNGIPILGETARQGTVLTARKGNINVKYTYRLNGITHIIKDGYYDTTSEFPLQSYQVGSHNISLQGDSNLTSWIYPTYFFNKWTMDKNTYSIFFEYLFNSYFSITNGFYTHTTGTITINPFDSKWLWDNTQSSLGNILVVIKDIDMTPDYIPTKQIVQMAETYFKYLNVKALRQNTNQKPKFVLPDEVYLLPEGGSLDEKIVAKLSFSNDVDNMTMFEMQDKGGDYAGGNGEKIYLHIEADEYRKMLLHGHGRKYQIKGSFINNKYGVPNENDTNAVVKIGVVATTTPDGGSRNEPFFSTVMDNMSVLSREVAPLPYKVTFNEKEPLIKNELQLINNSISYVDTPSGYNYARNVSLSGIVQPYDYFIKAHQYEVTDTTGKTLSDYTGSSGSGTYWENLAIGKNKVTLSHKKDFGAVNGYQARELTFLKLEEWDYEAYEGHIIEKHYLPHSDYINQYYDIGIKLPAFNPHIYYDNSSDIKLNDKILVQRETAKYLYDLGEIRTNNFDTAITKHITGSLKDVYGLRIIIDNELILKDKESGLEHPTRAKMVFLNENGKEITYDINNPNVMVGKNQKVRLGIKIPSDLNVAKDYVIIGGKTGILDKSNDIPQSQYILGIGRNKYFKEVIPEIELKAERLVGSFTLTFDNDYEIRELLTFNSTTLQERNPVSTRGLKGATLSEIDGAGILEMEDGDILEVTDNSGKRSVTKINISGKGSLKKEILLSDNVTRLAVKVADGKLQLGLNNWKISGEHELLFRVLRGSHELMNTTVKLLNPSSQFIIHSVEDLNFGNVIQGSKNNYVEADVEIENKGDIADLRFELNTTSPVLENAREEKLQVKEVKGVLLEKGNNQYQIKLNGKLDVPKNIGTGEYTGSLIMKLFIK